MFSQGEQSPCPLGGTRPEGTEASQGGDLTNFVLPRVVGDLHGVQLQALVALADVINPGDIGAHFIHDLHQLENNEWNE